MEATLYFAADDGTTGMELWKSDGEVTERVTDINSGVTDSLRYNGAKITVAGGNLYFVANDGTHGFELWRAERERPPVAVEDFYKVDRDEVLSIAYATPEGGAVATEFPQGESFAYAVAVQPDGKIVAAGGVEVQTGKPANDDFALVRYQADEGPFRGALDTTFGTDGRVTTDIPYTGTLYDFAWNLAEDMVVLPDGKILVVGGAIRGDETNDDFAVLRYNGDGTLDTTFGEDYDGDGQPEGYVTTHFGYRYDWASSVAVQPDGKFLVAGQAESPDGNDFGLVRYNADGTPDNTFGPNNDGKLTFDFGGNEYAIAVDIQSDGKIVMAGTSWLPGSGGRIALARCDSSGIPDPTFGTDGMVTNDIAPSPGGGMIHDMEIQDDDKIVVAGYGRLDDGDYDFLVARYESNGIPDSASGISGVVWTDFASDYDSAKAVTIQDDGKIVVAGSARITGPSTANHDFALVRYEIDGTLDSTFGDGGRVTTDFFPTSLSSDTVHDVAIAPDGKIVAAGIHTTLDGSVDHFAVARYNKDGSLDAFPAGLLDNDSDRNGDALEAVVVDTTTNGHLTLNSDGTFTYSPKPNFVGFDSFTYQAVDPVGLESVTTAVTIAVGQVAADPGGPYVIMEGYDLTLDASGSHDLEGDPLSFTWTLNGVELPAGQTPTLALSWSELLGYGIDDGQFDVTLLADDGQGNSDQASTTLTVNNVTPILVLDSAAEAVDEGGPFSRSGSFIDPGADVWTLTVDYGEGDGPQPISFDPTDKTFALDHVYADNGAYPVTVRIDDNEGGQHEVGFTITVDNVAPAVTAGEDQTDAQAAQPVNVAATFTDPGTADTHTATIDWGEDVGVEEGTVGAGTVSGSHTYAEAGVYFVTVGVEDDDGGSDSDSLLVAVDLTVVEGVTGGPGAPMVQVFSDGTELVVQQDATELFRDLLGNVSGLLVRGSTDSDTILVNIDNLSPAVLPNGIWTTGGEASDDSDNDTLLVNGTTIVTNYQYTTGGHEAGTIEMDGLTIHFFEFEPIIDNLQVVNRSFNVGTAGDHSIRLKDDPDNPGKSILDDMGSMSFESVAFDNPTDVDSTFEVNAGDGDNTIVVEQLDPEWTASLTVNAEGGNDEIIVQQLDPGWTAAVTVNGGDGNDAIDASASPENVTVDGGAGSDNVVTALGGCVSIHEGDRLTLSLVGEVSDLVTTEVDWGDGHISVPADWTPSHVYADDDEDDAYTVTVIDSGTPVGDMTVNLSNATPVLDVQVGPLSAVLGQTVYFNGTFSDPSFDDPIAGTVETFSCTIDWGDGTPVGPVDVQIDTPGAPGTLTVGSFYASHEYEQAGSYPVVLTFQDDDGGAALLNELVTVDVVAIQEDPFSGEKALAIGGTPNNDTIRFDRGAGPDDIVVSLNGADQGTFSLQGLQQLAAFGRAGDDTIEVAGSIHLAAWLYGGSGKDRLKGGAGDDVILGGDGNDLLVGKDGRDLLVGGTGCDRVVGNTDDDILIAGYTAYDQQRWALDKIMAEWTSAREYGTRCANLLGTGSGDDYASRRNELIFLWTEGEDATVFDDNEKDIMTGSSGQDWFFANLEINADDPDDLANKRDKITDLSAEEFAEDVDWILSG